VISARAVSSEQLVRRRLSDMEMGAAQVAIRNTPQEGSGDLIFHLEAWISRFGLGRRVAKLLDQADVDYLPGQFLLVTILLSMVGLIGGFLFADMYGGRPPAQSYIVALIGGLMLGGVPYLYLLDRKRTRVKRFTEQFPDTLEMISRSLRAGLGFNMAMTMVSNEMPEPVSGVFKKAADEQNLGLNLNDVMRGMVKQVPTLDVEFFASAVLIQRETGGNLAEVMDKLGQVIRHRFRVLGQVRVYTAQGRMTGYVLAALPFFIGVLLYLMSPKYIMTLFENEMGLYLVGIAAVLQIVGFFVIRRVITIEV